MLLSGRKPCAYSCPRPGPCCAGKRGSRACEQGSPHGVHATPRDALVRDAGSFRCAAVASLGKPACCASARRYASRECVGTCKLQCSSGRCHANTAWQWQRRAMPAQAAQACGHPGSLCMQHSPSFPIPPDLRACNLNVHTVGVPTLKTLRMPPVPYPPPPLPRLATATP
eukprot:353115-Chlamydomonas_euryale.AAC.6